MQLQCDTGIAVGYTSMSQRARVISEAWFAANGYCLACDCDKVTRATANTRCTDFLCLTCDQKYELKTYLRRPVRTLVDGAYESLMSRVLQGTAPTILMLERDDQWCVTGLSALHAAFLTPSVIEKRKPLAPTARRAGWVGCNIRLDRISLDAEICIVESRTLISKSQVRRRFRRLQPLASITANERGWTNLVLKVVREMPKQFTLTDMYRKKGVFFETYPNNQHVEAKVRQQLQVLRDLGLVRFDGNGKYSSL